MALSSSTVWEVRTGGSDTANGGGFVTGASGTDYSQQNSPQYSLTGLTSAGAGNVILTASASADMVGNILRVTGGTNFTVGWFQITAVSVGVSITVSTNSAGTAVTTGVGATGTAAVGGALNSPGIASSQMTVAGMIAYVKNEGTIFSITSVTTNVAGGTIGASVAALFVGYQTARTLINSDTGPTFQLNVSTATLFSSAINGLTISNIILDGNSQTAAKLTAGAGLFLGCTIKNFNTNSTGTSDFLNCLVTANSAIVCTGGTIAFCELTANTATPASCTSAYNVLTYGNTGAATRGLQITTAGGVGVCSNVTAAGNGSDGILIAAAGAHIIQNCILQSNGGFGINGNSATVSLLNNNAFFNNTSGQVSGTQPQTYNLNPVTYTADAFTNTSANVYTLNNTAGGGAALRAKSIPATFPAGLTADFLDLGAVQSQASAGSSGMLFIPTLEGM